MRHRVKLGVNIDHVATLRQARQENIPDLMSAARLVIAGGADSIVAHLREDRRHIQDNDIRDIRKIARRFDLEMAATSEMLGIALKVRPDMATIVPEKREEITTEGGLDVTSNFMHLKRYVPRLEKAGIRASLFIDPVAAQIKASSRAGASFIEIHTGRYARSRSKKNLADIINAVELAKSLGLRVNAGHGLDYGNVIPVVRINGIEELNIGFSIIARSIFIGLKSAVSEMKKLLILSAAIIALSCFSYAATVEVSSTPEVKAQATVEAIVPATTAEANPLQSPYVVPFESTAESASTSEVLPNAEVKTAVTFEAATYEVTAPIRFIIEKPIFIDVQPEHWAADSVNSLVRMGVTQGYPDGTFRGGNNLSRYEMAVFLSKMAHAGETKAAADEKIMEELKAEIYKIRYTLDMYKRQPGVRKPIYGSFTSRLRLGNVVSGNAATSVIQAPFGPVFDYRLIANYRYEFNELSFVRFGIDTMDSSLVGGRDLAREMFEADAVVESKSGFGAEISGGPGLVVHRESTTKIFPSDDYTAYLRPNSGIKVYYSPGDLDTGFGYRATSITSSGASSVNDVYGYIGYNLKNTFLGDIGLKYSMDSFTNDLKATYSTAESTVNMYEINIKPSRKTEVNLRMGATASQNTPHNSYVGLNIITTDLLRSGSSMRLFANKIGKEFLDYPAYSGILGLNLFDKLFQPSTYDIGMELSQVISRVLSFRMVADVVTGPAGQYGKDEPSSNSTFELDMDYGIFENAYMILAYKTYQSPSAASNATSDMLGLGFRYNY